MKKPNKPPNIKGLTQEEKKNLYDIFDNQDLMDELSLIEREYLYWDKFKYTVKHIDIPPKILWAFIKSQRLRNAYLIKISNITGFTFKYNPHGKILKRLHHFDMNLGGILEGKSIIPDSDKDRLLISSLMEEAIASSQLEGAVTTREVAKNMLRAQRKPKNESERMILNNYVTIKEILKYKDKKLTPEILKSLHAIVTKDTLTNQSDEVYFRNRNGINVTDINGEIFHIPPDYKDLDELINNFCQFANEDGDQDFIHPIIRGIYLHFLIGYIHPFADGNGRIARSIFYWYLISKGYWLIEYMSISRIIIQAPAQYARAFLFTEYDENDVTYFLDFNLKSMELALKSLKQYIRKKIEDKKKLYELIINENVNERQAEILKDYYFKNDFTISINEAMNKYGVVYQTARTDLIKLEQMGYLQSKVSGKKILYFKSKFFDSKIQNLKVE